MRNAVLRGIRYCARFYAHFDGQHWDRVKAERRRLGLDPPTRSPRRGETGDISEQEMHPQESPANT